MNTEHVPPSPAPPRLSGSPALAGERVAFTGVLASMTHKQAFDIVEMAGGVPMGHVSQQTTMLVIGEEGWPLEADGSPSVKLQQARKWIETGLPLRLVSESDWLTLLELETHKRDMHRQCTPAMLSQMLGVPVGQIRSWHRSGLIRPVRQVFRLPYFDFQEVASARRLIELLAAGVSRKQIEESLGHLREVLGEIPLGQLEILEGNRRLLYRDQKGLLETNTGQRVFDFGHPETSPVDAPDDDFEKIVSVSLEAHREASQDDKQHWSAGDWHSEACRLVEEHELPAAVEAFRLALLGNPQQPEIHFQLAETLYRQENLQGALERYHMAVELDQDYLEAWTQLGCVTQQLGDLQGALLAFDIALKLHPEYPDAQFLKGEVLLQLGRGEAAVPCWREYLRFDQRGPWADVARQRLGE